MTIPGCIYYIFGEASAGQGVLIRTCTTPTMFAMGASTRLQQQSTIRDVHNANQKLPNEKSTREPTKPTPQNVDPLQIW